MNTSTASPPATAGIEFRSVSKRYGGAQAPLVVKGISFVVPKGTLTTILGPSGCGKTTTLRMIAGLESPTDGQILIDGTDVTRLGPSERNVSMVFQSYALFPHMNVLDNVRYGLDVSGVPRDAATARAMAALELVGLKGDDARLPSELSGGQQQRVAVARALVLEPSVLLFDEPLSNLDARLRRSMRDEIRSLQQSLGLAVAYVTHDQSEALAVSDQIIVIDGGLIAQAGTPQDLYERPGSSFVAGFMGEALLLDGTALPDGTVQLGSPDAAGQGLRLAPRHGASAWTDAVDRNAAPTAVRVAVRVAVRPEAWQVGAPDADCLHGTLVQHAYLGNTIELTLRTALGMVLVVSSDTARAWRVGDVLGLRLSAQGVSVVAA
ncbi:MAG: ABC transporter ATP-binding protein [Burkholderiaceae bacterium]